MIFIFIDKVIKYTLLNEMHSNFIPVEEVYQRTLLRPHTERFRRLKFKLLSKALGHRVSKDAVAENFSDLLLNNRRS